ncbi:hypothetical protein DAPPUDRAFT_243033 [Daphnia pulex]|uniref:Uncharacterized protein n=1 Tax=Daphnia pulex TaxID=6669 RepID=E9GHY9_DAPPU|nr:hypothetical protein DAPPUDRAFT_243033 [Daphnia pulex]|eukprot:EFX80966.1 hypothetical protein DAPPUDRAFT_243033 [Daphnia pulex]
MVKKFNFLGRYMVTAEATESSSLGRHRGESDLVTNHRDGIYVNKKIRNHSERFQFATSQSGPKSGPLKNKRASPRCHPIATVFQPPKVFLAEKGQQFISNNNNNNNSRGHACLGVSSGVFRNDELIKIGNQIATTANVFFHMGNVIYITFPLPVVLFVLQEEEGAAESTKSPAV